MYKPDSDNLTHDIQTGRTINAETAVAEKEKKASLSYPADTSLSARLLLHDLAGEAAPVYDADPATMDPRILRLGKKQGTFTLADREMLPFRTELIDGVIYAMASPADRHQIVAGQIYHQLCNYIYSHDGPCTPMIAPADVRLNRDDRTVVQPDVFIVCKKEASEAENGKQENEEDVQNSVKDVQNSDDNEVREYGENGRKGRPRELSHYVEGAPDFVAEVLSPSTRIKDITVKTDKYRAAGVREYWIIDLQKECVAVQYFEKKEEPVFYSLSDRVPVGIYDGACSVDFAQIMERVDRYYGR